MSSHLFHLTAEHNSQTVAAALKRLLSGRSWSQVRKLIEARRIQVNGNLCRDGERKVKAGDVVKILDHSASPPATADDVRLVYVDEHLIVIQKPAGVTTLRHREETDLPVRRKQLQQTLDELVQQQLAAHLGISIDADDRNTNPKRQRGTSASNRRQRKPPPDKRLRLRPVHRLDRDTSGLMVFARTPAAEQQLIRMFAKHDVQRAYLAVVYGQVNEQTIDTFLVRDRGDGLRGSVGPAGPAGPEEPNDVELIKATPGGRDLQPRRAITQIRPLEHLRDYTILECRLETGRTHQIRIHLSEIGHRLCGEKVYTHKIGQPSLPETSGAPRQALHAASLAFVHPITGQPLRFQMPLPRDLKTWLLKLPKQTSP
ncbi:MAG TPA: pseudouridine synthase [Pirellulaceae bacterium]|jgi:23S rRNA pseudouridine1911/1915/1917 synthase